MEPLLASWPPLLISGAGIIFGWAVTARVVWRLWDRVNTLRERVAYLEAKANVDRTEE